MTTTTTKRPQGTGQRSRPRLKQRYLDEIVPQLRSDFGYTNVMQVPKVTKIVVNMGVGEAARDSKLIEGAIRDLATITGQKPAVTKARNRSLNSSCVRACRSALTRPCVATGCGSSWTAC